MRKIVRCQERYEYFGQKLQNKKSRWIHESIDSTFARFNTIITSLKAFDEGFSSKNYVRKFLRALHPKWRAKVTTIEESKDSSSLALDELIGNQKVHELAMEKDSEIYRGKKDIVKFIELKAKKESSDDETSTSRSDDEEYDVAVKNFKKFFRKKGELNFFLGLQIKQIEDEIFYNQSKYIKEMLKNFGLEDSKPTKTLMSTEINLTKNDEADSVDSSKYRADYISVEKACRQGLWMKQALIDYGIRLDDVPIMCDNKGDIDLSRKPVQHSRTNHIENCHHFLRDNVQKGNISIKKVASEGNIADIFTKPLKRKVFNYLRLGLGMMELIMNSDSPSS
uniref:Retrotransposon protein n=1 Tax=Tanacetum cinerariifolium TaxID=118510 RepID=A0A6L2NUV6_TANCI|nr:retrotransposon protein [Tanacetum cinerariifolium]